MTNLNKEQLKNEIYKLSRYQVANGNPILKLLYPTVETVELDSVISILDNVEKPIIPQFVANWIERNQEDDLSDTIHFIIYGLYANWPDTNSMVKLRKPVVNWIGEDRDNYFKLIDATRHGYTIEGLPKYFAKIKGHENIDSDDKYWNYCITDESLDVGDNKVHADVLAEYVLNATKDEWENLGINDDNADFVEAEELEE